MTPFALTPSLYGHIEVVCGPMFSGKTEELIRRVKRAQIARQRVQIFKPRIDDRYHKEDIVSHSAQSIPAKAIDKSSDILEHLYDSTRVVAIDEVQFFDEDVIHVVKKLVRRGIRVIIAGLDQDYKGIPFGPIPHLMAIADRVDKVQAICTVCGASATKTFRKSVDEDAQVLVGETDFYEARCGNHCEYFEDEELVTFRPSSLKASKPSKEVETSV